MAAVLVTMTALSSGFGVVQAQSTPRLPKGVHVVETYTSLLVWKNHKPLGRVWLTDQGALETWHDFLKTDQAFASYGFTAKNGSLTSVSWPTSKAVAQYYSGSKWNNILPYSNTLYSYESVKKQINDPTVFEANNFVPQFGVRSGQTVERLSDGYYLYPNGKMFKFNHYEQIPASLVPKNIISELTQYLHDEGATNYIFFRLKYKVGYGYTAD